MSKKERNVDKSLLECPYCRSTNFITAVGTKPYSPEEREVDFDRTMWHMQCLSCKQGWTEIYKIESVILLSEEV